MNKMKTELIEIKQPVLPKHWNYDESVKTGKQLFLRWKDMTEEMVNHFHIAREMLRGSGGDRRSEKFQKREITPLKKDWGDYCQEVSGIEDKKNARDAFNRMLNYFFPSTSVHFLSESSEWTTPEIIINKTIELFGEIDLDPCSNPDFPNVPAKKHYTKAGDGLSREWHGKIYMNPPYGSEIKNWIIHLCEQFENGNTQEAIALTPSRTDTEWYQKMKTYRRCFIWGRLKFGDSGSPAPFPSMVVYLGKNLKGFIRIFSDIGDIYGLLK